MLSQGNSPPSREPIRLEELEPLPHHLPKPSEPELSQVTAWYEARCPESGETLRLPRTALVEELARELMARLDFSEAKMYGVLLVRSPDGELGVLKAFSGKLEGSFYHPGWVPPMFDFEPSALEVSTKRRLAELKVELKHRLQQRESQKDEQILNDWARREERLKAELAERKRVRARRRAEGVSEEPLLAESKADSRLKRDFKRDRGQATEPILASRRELEGAIAEIKAERKRLSRALQEEMHQSFGQALWAEQPWSLASLFPKGPPTGTGECCAPKLLHFANVHGLTPLALAEFWWGDSSPSRRAGEFYPACRERCQALLGPLLSRVFEPMNVLYEDQDLLALEKPSGILTVPGRQGWNQDSLQLRLEPKQGKLFPIHRLDLETSGVVLFAKHKLAQSAFQALFAGRRVKKVYHALLTGRPTRDSGVIELQISSEPSERGSYGPCPQGKEAVTHFEVLDGEECRVEFRPHTGRSHQLRVHALHGLGHPIAGDRLYGVRDDSKRLMLHAHSLSFTHPTTGHPLMIVSPTPF